MNKLKILCGASMFAKEAIAEADIEFQYVCDSDFSKIGSLWGNLEIIHYDNIDKLLKHNEVDVFLANRYVSGTVKKLEKYFKNPNFKLYGFISGDYKDLTEITSVMDYYEKSDVIKNNILLNSVLFRCKEPIDDKILVYTMTKVGSRSLIATLEKAMVKEQIYLYSINNRLGFKKETIKWNNLRLISAYHEKMLPLVKDRIHEGKQLKVITVAREPIARNMSFLFFTLTAMFAADADIIMSKINKYANVEIFEDMFYRMIDHDYFLDWFDIELRPLLGIDIYEYPFEKEKGYILIEKDNIKLLVLKLEKLNNCAEVISEFAGVDKIKIITENSADDYWYKSLYNNFKKEFIPNEEYLNKIYKSKFVNYFYSDYEIEQFYKKYKKI